MEWELSNYYMTVGFSNPGGALSSIRDRQGLEYLWQGKGKRPGCQPWVLLPSGHPAVDKDSNGESDIEAVTNWKCIQMDGNMRCDFAGQDRIQFSMENSECISSGCPYFFRIAITYNLVGKKIYIRYTIINKGMEDIPLMIGGYQAIRCPLMPDENRSDYRLMNHLGEPVEVKNGIVATAQESSKNIMLLHVKEQRGVEIELRDFRHLVFKTIQGDENVAGTSVEFETWNGSCEGNCEGDSSDNIEDILVVKPRELKQVEFAMGIIN